MTVDKIITDNILLPNYYLPTVVSIYQSAKLSKRFESCSLQIDKVNWNENVFTDHLDDKAPFFEFRPRKGWIVSLARVGAEFWYIVSKEWPTGYFKKVLPTNMDIVTTYLKQIFKKASGGCEFGCSWGIDSIERLEKGELENNNRLARMENCFFFTIDAYNGEAI